MAVSFLTIPFGLILFSHRVPQINIESTPSNAICPANMTSITFYIHNTISPNNDTDVRIAGPTVDKWHTGFGGMRVMDNPLMEGPDPASASVGRRQGFAISASQHEVAPLMVANIILDKHKGSYLTLTGRNAVKQPVREMPISGGSGVFRNARGFALAHTVSRRNDSYVLEYNVCLEK